jgi:hypothetical protein
MIHAPGPIKSLPSPLKNTRPMPNEPQPYKATCGRIFNESDH